MTTALCFKDKMNELDKELNDAKKKRGDLSKCDKSLKLLEDENKKLLKYIKDNMMCDKRYLDDKLVNPAVSVSYIVLFYLIFFSVVGLFYNSLLTTSIGRILNEDVTLVNFLQEKNVLNYHLIWFKIQSCLNSFRFYLFIIAFIVTLIVNVGIIYTIILKGNNINYAMKVVSLSSIAIIGLTCLVANNVYFVKIFENTIGYTVSSLFSPKKEHSMSEFINSLFSHNVFGKSGIDFTFLYTTFRLDNLGDLLRDIGLKNPNSNYDFYIKSDNGLNTTLNNDLNILANMVVLKNTVGYMCWVLFATITSTIVSVKYLSR